MTDLLTLDRVARMLANLNCKVNLIALNPGPGIEFRTPAEERVGEFQRILMASGIPALAARLAMAL